MAPAFHPDGQLGPVAVEAGKDDYEGNRGRCRGRGWNLMVNRDLSAFATVGMGVRNDDLLDRMFTEACDMSESSGMMKLGWKHTLAL